MKQRIALVAGLMALLVCLSASAGEFRPLPIDLTGGAPVNEKYYRKEGDVEIYEDPTIHVEYRLGG